MDCSAEEQLVRLKLEGFSQVKSLIFDLPKRHLIVIHEGNSDEIANAINSLNLNSTLENTFQINEVPTADNKSESKLLWVVLLINFLFFLIEVVAGFISNSMGLVADSLDMLADAIVYGLSLYAVGKAMQAKKRVAVLSGYFQMILSILGFIEVLRRFFGFDEVPEFRTMVVVSLFALLGNAGSLILLQRTKSREAHMQASLIFTSNDVLVNLGVIVAGIAVYFTHSKYPDLIIGSLVFFIVARGAIRILKLSK